VDNFGKNIMSFLPLERSDCRGERYCGKWRICERCARIRAARFADRAKYLEARHGRLLFLRTSPELNTESEMKKLRDRVMREKLAPAGVWTIETGELFAGLHLNILAPEAAIRRGSVGFEYAEPVRSSVRAAAAYICKRTGMPHPEQYSGRIMGEWGTITQMVMATKDRQAIACQAAMVNRALGLEKAPEPAWIYFSNKSKQLTKEPAPYVPKTREEYAEIARRNLSNIYAIIASNSQKNTTVKA
jgi:hypothetical protein